MIEYATKALSRAGFSGLKNLIHNYYECKTKPLICKSWPATVMSEPSGNCNLKCKMCVRSAINYRKQGDIDFNEWVKVMDNEFPFWHFHGFIGIGEPLYHKNFVDMIEYLDNRNIWKFVVTNSTLLTDNTIDGLITHNLNRIFLSVDAATKKTLEKIREGLHYESTMSKIQNLVEQVKKRKSELEIILQSVCLKENAIELPELINLAYKLGIKEVRFQDIELKFDVGWSTKEHSLRGNRNYFQKYIDESIKKAKKFGIELKLYNMNDYTNIRKNCFAPWNQVYIRWNGLITPCCTTLIDKTYFYGNIFEEHFKDMWNNEKAQNFRAMARSNKQPKQCKNCSCL